MINITCEDNKDLMARYPDKHFDLAIENPLKNLIIRRKSCIFKEQNRLVRQHQTVSNIHINSTYMNTSTNVANNAFIKKVVKLSKQDSRWNLTTTHFFTKGNYTIDSVGNFYKNGKKSKSKPDLKGNIFVQLQDDNGVFKRFKIYQIVLQTFHPEGLKNGLSIDHKNRNRLDNRLGNLRYAPRKIQYSNRENIAYKIKEVLCINTSKKYSSCQDAEKDLGLVKNTVSRVARGKRKSIHGYYFKYV